MIKKILCYNAEAEQRIKKLSDLLFLLVIFFCLHASLENFGAVEFTDVAKVDLSMLTVQPSYIPFSGRYNSSNFDNVYFVCFLNGNYGSTAKRMSNVNVFRHILITQFG